ncbi:hypothetical protein DGN16_03100 [Xanthomonas citri pv. fuscans]|nr:hypothetical protein DGN16_03100 [Xanthomonas citri pv. fuscans]
MDYRDPETARRRSIFHQRIQIGFPGRSFVVDLQSYFSSLLGVQRVALIAAAVHPVTDRRIPW